MKHHTQKLVLVSGTLLLALLAGLTPTVAAQDATDWSIPSTIPKPAGAVITSLFSSNNIYAATEADRSEIGVAFAYSTNVGFSLWDGTTWALKNSDVTGATTRTVYDVIGMGDDRWGILAADAGTGVSDFYASTDDGVTWNLEEASVSVGSQVQLGFDGGLFVAYAVAAANWRTSGDFGTTWTAADIISDNKGTFGVAGTASLTVQTVGITRTPDGYIAAMTSSADNALYVVVSTDGLDWSVPYTVPAGTMPVDGGTTKLPRSIVSCGTGTMVNFAGATDNPRSTDDFDFLTTDLIFGFTRANGPNYICQDTAQAIPANPATNSVVHTTGRIPMAANSGGRLISYSEAGSTNEAYVWLKGPAAPSYALVYTAADIASGLQDLAMTSTRGYLVYIDSATGGQIKETHATIFSNLGKTFCPDPNLSPDYGYAYRRGADFFDQEDGNVPGIGLSTGYAYYGGSSESDWDYTAKAYSPGSRAFHENFTIEAGTDTATSVFRVAFMFISGAMPSAVSKGNGINTGNFADHVEVQLEEDGNAWRITFWYASMGGARTQIGSSINGFGDANDAQAFTIWVDTRDDAQGPFNGYSTTGIAIQQGPYIALTVPQAGPAPGDDNLIIGYRGSGVSPFPAVFTNEEIFDVWNIGAGSGALNPVSAIDENVQTGENTDDEGGHASTCIFDDAGESLIIGEEGSTPDDDVPTLTPGPTSTGPCDGPFCITDPPEGFTPTLFKLFLGVILMLGIAYGMYSMTGSPVMGVMGAVGGFLLAFAFGLIPLWVIVALVVIAVAVIFIRTKSAAT